MATDVDHEIHDHDRGLAFDLGTMLGRRRVLTLLAGAGVATLVGCGSSSDSTSSTTIAAAGSSSTAAGSSSSSSSSGSSDAIPASWPVGSRPDEPGSRRRRSGSSFPHISPIGP